jgi:hypothetical protein
MRRRVVCPRSHPASPHLRGHFVGFAVTRGISRGCPAARPASPDTRSPAVPLRSRWSRAPCSRLQCPCRPLIPTCSAPSRPGHGPPRLRDHERGREVVRPLAAPPSPAAAAQLAMQSTAGAHTAVAISGQQTGVFGRAEPAEVFHSEINYSLVITESGYPGLVITESGYSGLLNVTMATPIMTSPMTATIPRHSPIGTTQPPHVRPGTRACMADGGRLRWVNTACLMGYTT